MVQNPDTSDSEGMLPLTSFGVRRQSEAATALWLDPRTRVISESKAVSPDKSGLPPHCKFCRPLKRALILMGGRDPRAYARGYRYVAPTALVEFCFWTRADSATSVARLASFSTAALACLILLAMKKTLVSLLVIFHVSVALCAQQNSARARKTLAITHVTLVDTSGGSVKREMTVIIADGRIAAIGKRRTVRVPKSAQVVNAAGKFLIPGLWDMHVHIGNDDFDKMAYLRLFIVNGVTGIRIMNGMPQHHLWRQEIESGGLLGPRMVIASRIIDGPNAFASGAVKVNNQEEAREVVRKAKQEGADFVKVHDTLSRDAYFAVIDEAKRLGLTVEGHVPASITAKEASDAGQKSIEHFTGLAEAETDLAKADTLIASFKQNHTWNCPTLIMRNNYAVLDDRGLANDPRLRYVKPSWKKSWLNMTNGSGNVPVAEWTARRETVRREKALVGRFQKAGVGILAGTDDISPYVMPGFSLHDELVMLVESGLSPMQALQAATLNPAKFFNQLDSLGTVDKGKFADLVLLDGNPLEDIHNTTKISSVVVNGRFLDRQQLDSMLAEIEAAANSKR
jgi:imidazolonepropionase-like amidohydrolase